MLSAFINYVAIICKPSLSNSDCSHFKSPIGQGDYMLNRSRNSRSLHLLQLQPGTKCKKIQGNNWTNTDSVTTHRGISDLSLLDIYDIWWSITQLLKQEMYFLILHIHPFIHTLADTHSHAHKCRHDHMLLSRLRLCWRLSSLFSRLTIKPCFLSPDVFWWSAMKSSCNFR